MRRRSRFSSILRLSIIAVVALGGGFLSVFLYQNLAKKNDSQALSATEFQPGRIIDDSIFYNPNTMTAAEIDAFIDSHSPACDMWGNGYSFGGVQNKEYARRMREAGNSRWHEPPYVCISEFYENPETHVTNFETNGVKQPGMLSAGEIIYKAAQTYNVNPQVLLVMLKKESYAWGDDWPLKWEYNTVMGYACPDGAPCNEEYFGFYNQMMTAAWQLNYYREHIYSYNYRPYATNNILYNPDRSCGSKPVYLENIATTSLYIYTPYVPNDDALRNYPGTSWCGSYGNRNFYMYFREWFGDTIQSKAPQLILEAYESLDGENGILGKLSNPGITYTKKMNWQCYQNGCIVGSDDTGYYISTGKIREAWAKSGYQTGELGLPIENITYTKKMNWQCYQNGCIVGSDDTGYYISTGKIREAWAKSGYQTGELGLPIENITYTKKMNWQCYQNGCIVGSDDTGYYISTGKIREAWAKSGYQTGELGLPIENITYTKKMNWQCYQNGCIVGSDDTGYYISTGKIREAWAKSGYQTGELGLPIENITYTKKMNWQCYQNGCIVGSDDTGYYISTGKIREAWAKSGYQTGELGLPIENITYTKKMNWQCYQNGCIVGSDDTGYYISTGKIREAWAKSGYQTGELGLPIENITYTNGVYRQNYQGGHVYGNSSIGFIIVLTDNRQ